MNSSPLVLTPSGHVNISASTPDSATAAKPAKAPGNDSTFAGALQDAGSKPARKAASKVLAGGTSGGALPVAGKYPPPKPAAMPQPMVTPPPVAVPPPTAAETGIHTAAKAAAAADGEGTGGAVDAAAVAAAMQSVPAVAGDMPIAEGTSIPAGAAMPADAAAASATGVGAGAGAAGPAAGSQATSSPAASSVAAQAAVADIIKDEASPPNAAVTAGSARGGTAVASIKSAVKSTTVAGVRPAGTVADAPGTGGDDSAGGSLSPATGVSAGLARGAPLASVVQPATQPATQPADSAGNPAGDATITAAIAATPATVIALAAARAAASTANLTTAAQNAAGLASLKNDDKRSQPAAEPPTLEPGGADTAAGVFQLTSPPNSGSIAATALPATLQLHANADSGELAQGLSDQVTYMVDHGLNGARLQVNPPDLGPVELRIAVAGGHAQVWMTAHSAVTREALESSSPKLREMLGAQGFGQVSVDVSQRSFQDRSAQAQSYQGMSVERGANEPAASVTGISLPRTSPGALDAYA